MKFITINQSVRSLSNEALAALAAGKAASKEGGKKALEALAAGAVGGYSIAADREMLRRARKRRKRLAHPAAV